MSEFGIGQASDAVAALVAVSIELAAFLAAWLLLWSPIAWILARRLAWDFPAPPTPPQKIPLVLSLYSIAPVLLWVWVRRSGESWANLGWVWGRSFVLNLAGGLGLALLSLALFWGLEWGLGWIKLSVDRGALLKTAGPVLAVAIAISTIEELLFRGFVATRLASIDTAAAVWGAAAPSLAAVAALALANLWFALLHLPWDRWQRVVPQLPGLWLLGMVLSLACLRSGDLGLAIGLHGGWVWAIATLDTLEGLESTHRVPTWITGVDGSLLAGLFGLIFLGAVGVGLGLAL